MNKLMGFLELKHLNIPTIPWKEFSSEAVLDDRYLWTLRTALKSSSDLNLPRAVGVNSHEAVIKGNEFLSQFSNNGKVIYYPYFIAEKSGVVEINSKRIVIEAVEKDLWNFVTYGHKNVTITYIGDNIEYCGDEKFLLPKETEELLKNVNVIKSKYRGDLNEGKSLIAEWSFAYNTDINNEPIGEKYLVFYELRSID